MVPQATNRCTFLSAEWKLSHTKAVFREANIVALNCSQHKEDSKLLRISTNSFNLNGAWQLWRTPTASSDIFQCCNRILKGILMYISLHWCWSNELLIFRQCMMQLLNPIHYTERKPEASNSQMCIWNLINQVQLLPANGSNFNDCSNWLFPVSFLVSSGVFHVAAASVFIWAPQMSFHELGMQGCISLALQPQCLANLQPMPYWNNCPVAQLSFMSSITVVYYWYRAVSVHHSPIKHRKAGVRAGKSSHRLRWARQTALSVTPGSLSGLDFQGCCLDALPLHRGFCCLFL